MRIQTNYKHKISQGEVCVEPSVTDGSQYVSISEALQRYIRGESLDLMDYTTKNPLDCKDKFDVMDAYLADKKEREKLKKAEEKKVPKPEKNEDKLQENPEV